MTISTISITGPNFATGKTKGKMERIHISVLKIAPNTIAWTIIEGKDYDPKIEWEIW